MVRTSRHISLFFGFVDASGPFTEPSNMLDVPSITFLSNYLQTYRSTVLVVSHDRAFLNEVATDIIHQHSERLDYYKGANFGRIVYFTPSQT
jgi:ATPase subunit of ABC transporter with duplicated ATPase domains